MNKAQESKDKACPQPYYVFGRPVFLSPDDRMWVICESHPETDDKICVCRNVVSLSAQALGHTAVWSRSDLRPSNSIGARIMSDKEERAYKAVSAIIEGMLSSDLTLTYGTAPYKAMREFTADMMVDVLAEMYGEVDNDAIQAVVQKHQQEQSNA